MPAKNAKYTYGNGSRKAATATARLYKGKGEITINGKPALDYFSGNKTMLAEITDPLALTQKQKNYDISIRVLGGGLAGQVDAIKLAISRALVLEFPEFRPVLKKAGLMKRDPREKERKHYGLRSARKREQFSKR
ncbi:30S ribosomal protein S9 [Candidatus Saccharibacteria bacterium]|nr:30S ribosomal protein S9 [Candidatus Saccharibacteria bacterium]